MNEGGSASKGMSEGTRSGATSSTYLGRQMRVLGVMGRRWDEFDAPPLMKACICLQEHALDRFSRVSLVHARPPVLVSLPGHVSDRESVLRCAVWVSYSVFRW